ncbi:hypothetical protein CANCADRAFT_148637 [Tortispora caseinolytica NRRL Y-17796]|uniref:4-hydroxybenzoate polyprenyltransferase, mitochondrial n=1 Tax=Tortispora caseinolytica NRRL Y-17796 TaxID=767744 RepID=A0A1E4TDE0_9ASCO|nr:hypothetical protein CANCADRAFT_148637 [Tortispora caseinolytica NRRL Y-17796]
MVTQQESAADRSRKFFHTAVFNTDEPVAAVADDPAPALGVWGKLPAKYHPYVRLLRLEKPAGSMLLFIPCAWSATAAAYATDATLMHTAGVTAAFGIGSIIMRAVGCIINDMLDRDLDAKVARTSNRPLAAGHLTQAQAIKLMSGLLVGGLGVLLSLPSDCFLLGAASLPFIATYPLFKRFTYYPQAMLSFCFTWGALIGFPAMGIWNWPAMLALHGSCFAWCMTYDTIYAHQDKKWDIIAGVKSTALAWGDKSKPIMSALTAVQLSLLGSVGYMLDMSYGFMGGFAITAYRLIQMIRRVDLDNPADCWRYFNSNIQTGLIMWAGFLVDFVSLKLGLF